MELNKINENAFKKELVEIIDEVEHRGNELEDLENYNDIERSNGLSRWALQKILDELDSTEIGKKILDRSLNSKGNIGEFGCDIFENEFTITVGQTKYHEKFGEKIDGADIEKIEHTIEYLKTSENINEKIQYGPLDENKEPLGSEEFQDASKAFIHEDKSKQIIFITTESLKEDTQAFAKWNDLKKKYPEYQFEMYDIERILRIALDPITPDIPLEFNLKEWYEKIDPVTGKLSRFGIISGLDLEEIVKKHKDVIFNWNPRKSLGRSSVTFSPIIDTLSDDNGKKRLYKKSNGINCCCQKIEVIIEEIFDDEVGRWEETSNKINIKNLKIVNGRQTTFALQEFQRKSANDLSGAEIEIRIHEVVDREEGREISEANNKQNKIDEIDLLALDPRIGSGDMNDVGLQTRIDDKFDKKWFLESQKGAWSELKTEVKNSFTERRRIEKEPLIRRTIAYCVNLSKAMISVPELVDKKNNGLLDSFFQQREIDMLLANIFGESILELRKKQDKNDKDGLFKWNLLGKKVLQYNLLSMIHKEIEEFTDEEKTKIEKSIIKIFHDMKTGKGNKDIPPVLLDVVDHAYNRFMVSFDYHQETYYPEVTVKIIEDNVEREELQKVSPTHRQIELTLKGDGDTNVKGNLDPKILDKLIKTAKNLDERLKMPNLLKNALKKFLPETVGDESDENGTDEEKDDSSSESKEEENNS